MKNPTIGNSDERERRTAVSIAVGIGILLLVLGVGIALIIPALSDFIHTYFSPGLGLKDAAVISFFVTVVVIILFAVTAGDGLIGEVQFMLGAFFSFFLFFWIMIAWIF